MFPIHLDMPTTFQALFELDSAFNRAQIRLCEINGTRHACVIDVIRAITEKGDQAKVVWMRLKQKHTQIQRSCNKHQFAGQVGRSSPVADAETMLTIISCLFGTKADEFRLSSARLFLATLNPSREYIEELKERREVMNDGQHQQGMVNSFFVEGNKEVRLAPRIYNQTWLYVRVRLPDGLLRENLSNRKQLTLSIMKFGIAYSLQERNTEYLRDPDNGFMLFSFQCHNRTEAEIVENIMKHEFRNITVLGSREYVDAVRLAELLQVPQYSTDVYADYIKVAQQLFAFILRLIKRIWLGRYPHYGLLYGVVENPLKRKNDEACTSVALPLEVELTYPSKDITTDMLSAMNMSLLDTMSPSLCISTIEPCHIGGNRQIVEGTVPTPTPHTRSSGPIISRDIITGVEVQHVNNEQAANSCGITPAAMRRTYIGTASQMHGKHWRKVGMPYWIPPKELVFDSVTYEKGHAQPIMATSDSKIIIYESKIAASKILRLTNPRTLSDVITSGQIYLGYVWSEVLPSEYGTWSNQTLEDPGHAPPVAVVSTQTGANGRCNGKIISRDLSTGVETVYESLTRAAASNNISAHSLGDNFVDKPRHVRGKHFRTFASARFWSPPPYFRYDPSSFQKKTNGNVISTSESTGEKLMYESTKAAAALLEIGVWGIQQFMDTGKAQEGLVWTKATEADYDVWETT